MTTPTVNDNVILSFKAIHGFVLSLADEFKSKQHSLALYARLIEKTTFSHDAAMRKHIACFAHFCIRNKLALEKQDVSKLAEHKIQFSERVFINIKHLFSLADSDTKRVIWEHLLTISALVNPSSQAKKHLEKFKSTESAKESDFLANFVSQVEDKVSTANFDESNPMDAISSIMNSGIMENLMSSLGNADAENGLDMGKLMGMAQGLLSQLGGDAGGGLDLSAMMGSLSNGNIDMEAIQMSAHSKRETDDSVNIEEID